MPTESFLGPFTTIPPAQRRAVSASDAAGAPPAALDFEIQVQQVTRWCWAAVTASITDYYAAIDQTPVLAQCAIASQFLHVACCVVPLPQTDDWAGNQSYVLETALKGVGHLQGYPVGGQMPFPDIVTDISAKRPICCKIDWGDGDDDHYVVIMGCHDDSNQDVIVLDPSETAPHNGAFTYANFAKFAGGHWVDTFRTK